MPTLKIVPGANNKVDIGYYKLLLDGNKLDEILISKEKEFQIPPGTHKLKAKIDFISSSEMEFSISDNETRTFIVSRPRQNMFLLWLPMLLVILNPVIKHYLHIDLFIWTIGLLVVYFIYMYAMGKNKFIKLDAVG